MKKRGGEKGFEGKMQVKEKKSLKSAGGELGEMSEKQMRRERKRGWSLPDFPLRFSLGKEEREKEMGEEGFFGEGQRWRCAS